MQEMLNCVWDAAIKIQQLIKKFLPENKCVNTST